MLDYSEMPFKSMRDRSREIDRRLGYYAGRLSCWIWPWPELRLLWAVGSLAALDFATTLGLLEFSGKNNVYESGLVATWALDTGGFPLLLVIDISAAGLLSLVALASRRLYAGHGLPGYARAAFVFVLLPYIAFTAFAVANNVVLWVR